MSWLAGLKCGDPRCGCTGNPIRTVVHTSNYVGIDDAGNVFYPSDIGMGLDMSGPVRRITGNSANPASGAAGNDANGKTTFGRQS